MAAGKAGHLRDVVATNLRRKRAELGLSQEALAHEAGLHRTFVGAVERSETNISLDNVERLATALRIDGWQLLMPNGADQRHIGQAGG
jgi:transcriptional regulator with XRE-family HTH domain